MAASTSTTAARDFRLLCGGGGRRVAVCAGKGHAGGLSPQTSHIEALAVLTSEGERSPPRGVVVVLAEAPRPAAAGSRHLVTVQLQWKS